MVGSNRIVMAPKIVSPVGDANLAPEEEWRLRRSLVERALESLKTEIKEPTLFTTTE